MSYSQVQKSVVGSTNSQSFGRTVAIDGYYSIVSNNIGNVYLYKRLITRTWEYSEILCSGSGSELGASLDIFGEYFVVGDPSYSTNKGRVAIYSTSSPSSPLQLIEGGASGDKFGSSVSMNGLYLAVGAPEAGLDKSGKVYIYTKDGEIWTAYYDNPLLPTISTDDDYFGCSIGLYNNICVIGARGDNQATGAIYIFNKDASTEEWYESSKILSSDGEYGDQFGGELSVSNGYMAVSSKFWDGVEVGDDSAGAVYIFKYDSSWYEIDKLTGISESSYTGNNFGSSIRLKDDYLIIGSPGARSGMGTVDIFYKYRSWGHLIKLLPSDIESGDNFGNSVDVSGSYVVVGSYKENPNDLGAIYFFEDSIANLRLAQEFEVNKEFLPSKASLFLRRSGKNSYNYWRISNSSKNVIDATNFSTLTKSDNRVVFADTIDGYTGNGYMFLDTKASGECDVINYNVRAIESDTFYLWIRCISLTHHYFSAEILLDGVVYKTLNENITNPSTLLWSWIGSTLVLPDTQEHILGIKIKESGNAIDKIYIDKESITPYAEGPAYSISPYFTAHLNIYTADSGPLSPIFIYDYKNSITEIVQDDWYNFNIKVLDEFHGYLEASDFEGGYFMVLSCTGSNSENYIVWDMVANDEYIVLPSAFRI